MNAASGNGGPKKRPGRQGFLRAGMILISLFLLVVFLYLIRLEAHTSADVFLPVDYHAGMDENGAADTDALNTYYQQYVQQEGRPYTIRQDLLLARLAYIEAPEGFRGEASDTTVRDLCNELERLLNEPAVDAEQQLGRSRDEILALVSEIGEHPVIGDLLIREVVDKPSGFAGYVLENGEELTFTLRGTDDLIDTFDNFILLPFNLSIQYKDVRALLAKYNGAKRIWLTGHSKGGHNAIYAASIDERCHATAFNAPGFGILLTDAQHDGLDSGVNYVINGDITGFLLFHLERRVVLDSVGSTENNKHRLDSFFAVDDLTAATQISSISLVVEWITQLLWLALLFLVGYASFRLLRKIYLAIFAARS